MPLKDSKAAEARLSSLSAALLPTGIDVNDLGPALGRPRANLEREERLSSKGLHLTLSWAMAGIWGMGRIGRPATPLCVALTMLGSLAQECTWSVFFVPFSS